MTAAEVFANDATTTVVSGGTDAPSGGTQETWTVASSASFHSASTGVSQFHVADAAAPSEIIAVTNISGTTWTVTRGAESTTPVTHVAGFTIVQVVTAGFLGAISASGTVTSVTAADASIVVSGTPAVAPALATGTLDVIAAQHPPAASWSNNSKKITSLANGSSAQDAVAYGQLGTAAFQPSSAFDASGAAASAQAASTPVLVQTAVQTANYAASANQLVRVDTTSGNITVTLPNAPGSGTITGVKQVTRGGTNTVTVNCAGSDVFNKAGGGTSLTLTLQAQGTFLQYNSGIWYIIADDLPLSQLDLRYLNLAGGAVSGSLAVSGALTTPPVTLTDGTTIPVNAALSNVFRLTLTGNHTLSNPTNLTDDQPVLIEVIQDSTGGRLLSYGSMYSFPSSIGTPVLSTAPGDHDFILFRYNANTAVLYCNGFVPQQVNASPYTVSQGGTGQSSLAANELIAAGTTPTGAVQQIAAGALGTVLMGAGASALPVFTALDPTATDIAPTGTAGVAGNTGKVPDAGHVHANTLHIPQDSGFQAWTFDPGYCNAAAQPASSQQILLVKFPVRQTTVLTNVYVHVTVAGSALTSNGNFLGVYDMSGNRQGVTSDQSGIWVSTGVKLAALASPYTAPAGYYYLAACVNVTTGSSFPTFRTPVAISSSFMMNAGLSGSALRVATQTTQSSLPTTLTYSSNVQTSGISVCAVFT